MKRLYGGLILFLCYFPALAQVSFELIPRDLQLYPRDATNSAEVVVSGKITAAGFSKIGMQVRREGVLTQVVSQTVAAGVANAAFRLSSTIKAEPAEYSFRVFVYKGTDSTLAADRKRVVCGDVYVIHGQSNALALPGLDTYYSFNFDDKYLRNCAYPYNSSNIPGEMSWYPAKDPYGSVGGFGLTLQRLILQTYGIPTVVLNGAFGGTGIATLSARDPVNHTNLSTYYGRLLYRAQWAGVDKKVKAFIWKQGEDEAGNGPTGYGEKFNTLYNQIHEDYGDVRMYVGQINILADRLDGAAALRDFQRRTKYQYKNLATTATVGTPYYDGIHYTPEGHQVLAFEQFRQIARDFYGSTDTLQINSPDVKKLFYNARKDSVTMVFDSDMQMVYKADSTVYSFATGAIISRREMKDFFYLDRQAGLVTGGLATGNRVKLGLNQPVSAKTMRYLPAYFSDAISPFYDGPLLKNTRGMRAFSFDSLAIADAIATVTTLAAKPLTEKQIQLNWTASASGQTQLLERADGTPTAFKQIASLTGQVNTYTDANLPDPFGTYYYRLRAFSSTSESVYSNVINARPLVLGLESPELAVSLYPNPLSNDRTLHVDATQVTFTALVVRDVLGRVVKSWSGSAKNAVSLGLDQLEAGLYIADLHTANGQILRRKLVIR